MSALLDALRATATLKTERIFVGGMRLRIREMSLSDRDAFVAAQKEGRKIGPLLMARCVIDDDDTAAMTGEEDQIAEEISPAIIDDIAVKILTLSGLASKND